MLTVMIDPSRPTQVIVDDVNLFWGNVAGSGVLDLESVMRTT